MKVLINVTVVASGPAIGCHVECHVECHVLVAIMHLNAMYWLVACTNSVQNIMHKQVFRTLFQCDQICCEYLFLDQSSIVSA